MNAIFLRYKKDNKKKAENLEDRLFLQYFSTFLPLWFLLFFFPYFALGFLDIGQQASQLDK